ncbi:hypothetical protein EDB89DRAFT_1902855 [Lactarius sanguifluus]|nr:hypothetical protein EDB89DRAFT_1902855 [Lactarius sanguifluus]
MEPARRSHGHHTIDRHRSRPRPFLKVSLVLRKVPLAVSEPSGVPAWLGSSSGPRPAALVPGFNQREYWRAARNDPRWEHEVCRATAVLERLLESWEYGMEHIWAGRVISDIGCHVTLACDLPRTVQKSLDELAPRLRLECTLGFRIWAELESSPL